MAKGKGKQRKRVRERSWDETDEDTVTREPRRVRGRDSGVGAPVDAEERDPDGLFSDIDPNAIVLSPYGMLAFVDFEGTERLCRVDEGLVEGKSAILATGDRVLVESQGDDLVVTAVAPRTTKLSRPAVGHGGEQVLAANVDVLVVVAAAAKPAFKPGLVDRYIVAGEVGGTSTILCINKMDLVDAEPADAAIYRDAGVPVVNTSCVTGVGIDLLRDQLEGRLGILAGHSGVGKSSLINTMDPAHEIATQEISSSTSKGRHTTSSSKLYHLEGGVRIIDTPGARQLGLWNVSLDELDFYFAEFARFAVDCRFRDCTHVHEPGCAVRNAVESSEIPPSRYASYRRIRESLE